MFARPLTCLCCLAVIACDPASKPDPEPDLGSGSEPTPQETSPPASTGPSWFADADGDGYGTALDEVHAAFQPDGYVDNADDCDDGDRDVNPDADELCNDVDDDCDALLDEDDPDLLDASPALVDSDGDGYGAPDPAGGDLVCNRGVQPGDCDDTSAAVNPGAQEGSSPDGDDNDCNGWIDEGIYPLGSVSFVGDAMVRVKDLGDVDGDGLADFSPDGYHVCLGRGTLPATVRLAVDSDVTFDAPVGPAGDQDGDGTADLWVGGTHLLTNITSLSGTVDAAAVAVAQIVGDYTTVWGEPGDVDGDGFADFGGAVASGLGGSVIMPGGARGDLDVSLAIADLDAWWAHVVPDLDGDGFGEVLSFDGNYRTGLRLGGAPLGNGISPRQFSDYWRYEDSADVDGDGLTDLIVCDAGSYVCYVIREPDVPPGTSATPAIAWITITGVKVLTAIDLNGDGSLDLVGGNNTVNGATGGVYAFDSAAIAAAAGGVLDASAATAAWEAVGASPTVYNYGSDVRNVGDIDGDGYDDLIITTTPINSTISTAVKIAELAYGGR